MDFSVKPRISVKALNWTEEPVTVCPDSFLKVFKWSGRASKLNNAFKLFTDNWGKIEKANKAIGKGLDLYDFVISWMLVLHVEYDQIVQLMLWFRQTAVFIQD